jgi:hypothetical protein
MFTLDVFLLFSVDFFRFLMTRHHLLNRVSQSLNFLIILRLHLFLLLNANLIFFFMARQQLIH